MDLKDEVEYQEEDGAVITIPPDPKLPRRLLGFCGSLQETCEMYGEFARVRSWTIIGIPR